MITQHKIVLDLVCDCDEDGKRKDKRMDWQQIETAPTDGTAVLVTNGRGVWIAKHKAIFQYGYNPDSPWFCLMLNKDHIPGKFRAGKPTHWMPLPQFDEEAANGVQAVPTTLCWNCNTAYPMGSRQCPGCCATNANEGLCSAMVAQKRELRELRHALAFYKRRCDLLQIWQSAMRDPERTLVCDVLANGQTLPPSHANGRYGSMTPNAQVSGRPSGRSA
jgi:hypothetical protein